LTCGVIRSFNFPRFFFGVGHSRARLK
jgi:hypothetical protein